MEQPSPMPRPKRRKVDCVVVVDDDEGDSYASEPKSIVRTVSNAAGTVNADEVKGGHKQL